MIVIDTVLCNSDFCQVWFIDNFDVTTLNNMLQYFEYIAW